MSKTITIGKDGEQHFPITGSMVSRVHAQVTIDDDGTWTIKDLNSANGTFVRDTDGNFVRVGEITITPDSFICLGPDNSQGCMFYACHLIDEQNDFHHEFHLLSKYAKRFTDESNKVERQTLFIVKGISVISLILLFASFTVDQSVGINLLRVGTAISTLYSLVANPKKKLVQIHEKASNFYRCPNPGCSHWLTVRDIENCQCPRCKAHA